MNFFKSTSIKTTSPKFVGTLPTIYEDIQLEVGVFLKCHNCFSCAKVANSDKQQLVFLPHCFKCFGYKTQASVLSGATHDDITSKLESMNKWLFHGRHHGKSILSHYVNVNSTIERYVNLIEDILMLAHHMILSRNTFDRYVAMSSFCKKRGSRFSFTMLVGQVFADIFGTCALDAANSKRQNDALYTSLQKEVEERVEYSAQNAEDVISGIRSYLSMYEEFQKTPIFKKVRKMTFYLLAVGLLDGVNITYDSIGYSRAEARALKNSHQPGVGMVHSILDTITFICDRGIQYFKSGDSSVIFHSGNAYEKWLSEATTLIRHSKLMTNPGAHGLSKFEFLARLKDAIEKGRSVVKHTPDMDKGERMYVQRTLDALMTIEADELTKKAAQEPRKDPFCVLLHGASSICKSQLKQILFYHYGKLMNLPISSEYMYTRVPTDDFWPGFDSSKWCIVMDDIAFLKPNGELDPTLKEVLQVKNSVPYVPPQAALEDKGRTPVRAELLLCTTNTKALNLEAYFSCPFAIARRFNYVVTTKVKPEFTKNGHMADSDKIPFIDEGNYMNIWDFEVSVAIPESDIWKDSMRAKHKVIENFSHINDFLAWYIQMAKKHDAIQLKALNADDTMANIDVCLDCFRPQNDCKCDTLSVMTEHSLPSDSNLVPHLEDIECDDELISTSTFIQPGEFNGFSAQTAETENAEESVDDPAPANPVMDILRQDCTTWYRIKLWFYLRAIGGKVNDLPDILADWIDEDSDVWLDRAKYLFVLLISAHELGLLIPLFSLVIFLISVTLIFINFFVLTKFYFEYKHGFYWKLHLARKLGLNETQSWLLVFRLLGEKIRKVHYTHRRLAAFSAFLATPIVLYAVRQIISGKTTLSSVEKDLKGDYKEEGLTGSVPVAHETEKPVFYWHDPYKTTDLEVSAASKAAPEEIIEGHVRRNLARFIIHFEDGIAKVTTALNVKGNIWMLNKHAFYASKPNFGYIDVIMDDCSQNVSRNAKNIRFEQGMIRFLPNSDLAFIQIRSLEPGKDLTKYFPISSPPSHLLGKMITISMSGVQNEQIVENLHLSKCAVFGVPAYNGFVKTPTLYGDCGSPYLTSVAGAHIILGIHMSGASHGGVFCHKITQHMISTILSQYEAQVDAGTHPISAPGYPRSLTAVGSHSTFRWLESGCVSLKGSFVGYRPKHKSKVTKTFICDHMTKLGYVADFGAPDMSWKPWHLAIKDMTSPNFDFSEDTLKECEDAYLNDILFHLGDKVQELQVYSQDVALNGASGVTFVDRLNCSTSAGNPFKKSKKHFMKFDEDNKIVELDPVIQDRINAIETCYSNMTRFNPQFCGHLKDEPTPTKKIIAGKTRVFTGGEFAWSVVVRKVLLSHIRLMQNNPFVFESMPGIVAQSSEWGKLYDYITKFGLNKIVAGDYAKFDKKMMAAFILSAFRILRRMAESAKWTDEELGYIDCIAMDTAFANIDFNGDYISIQGNPSGHPLTVIINCLVNALYMRYAFRTITDKPLSDFKKYVSLATYGDDNIMGVSDDCPEFNHTAISAALSKIGVVYTMAEKEAESVPYIHVDDSSFLKRKFRYDVDVGAVLAPLDESSFNKMLTAYVNNGEMAPQAHSVCVIETCIREYFFYGKDVFDEKRAMFEQVVLDTGLTPWLRKSTFPTYNQLAYEFWMRFGDSERAAAFE